MLLLIYPRREVKGCENSGSSDKFQMARSGKSFIELVTFSELLKERPSGLKDDVNKEGHAQHWENSKSTLRHCFPEVYNTYRKSREDEARKETDTGINIKMKS